MKRIFDICISFLGLVVLFPVCLLIGFSVKLQDGGPVLFRQKRVGKDGYPFILLKFRTMSVMESAGRGIFEPGFNARTTRVGKFLRRSKLDEIPQLFNVLIGDMSLVGPRPEIQKWVDYYPERWKIVLQIRPGITDNAALVFRNEEMLLATSVNPDVVYRDLVLPKKLDLYQDYVVHHTFLGDLVLLIRTFWIVLFR